MNLMQSCINGHAKENALQLFFSDGQAKRVLKRNMTHFQKNQQ